MEICAVLADAMVSRWERMFPLDETVSKTKRRYCDDTGQI